MTKIRITVDSDDIVDLNRLRGISEDRAQDSLLRVIEAGNEAIAAVPKLGEVIARTSSWATIEDAISGRAPATVALIRQRILNRLVAIPSSAGVNGGPSEGATLVDMYLRLGHDVASAALAPTPLDEDLRRQRRASTAP